MVAIRLQQALPGASKPCISATPPSTAAAVAVRKLRPVSRAPGAAFADGFAPGEAPKMVLCVNTALRMGKGKIGAQCAHAAVGVLQHNLARPGFPEELAAWDSAGHPKIVLRARDEAELAQLAEQAAAASLPWHIVEDAGRTQVAPGSRTVLAIGPGPASVIDTVTASLGLL